MKREYKKPIVVFENFCMSTNIAAGCEFKNDLKGQGECGYPTRTGDVVFVLGITGCTYTQEDTNGNLCYHVPTENTNIFNS